MKLEDALSDHQRSLLASARAARLSYGVRLLASPGPDSSLVVVLGEAHLKLAPAERIGHRLVDNFALRGVESFQAPRVLAGRALIAVIHGSRVLLRVLSCGLIKGSTITYARARSAGHTALLEVTDHVPVGLHVGAIYVTLFFAASLGLVLAAFFCPFDPVIAVLQAITSAFNFHFIVAIVPAWALRRREWVWMVHPFLAIVTVRDRLMARGTVRMLAEHPGERAALVIMGRAHLAGYERELVTKYGFARVKG
jgi:hypothetical protein